MNSGVSRALERSQIQDHPSEGAGDGASRRLAEALDSAIEELIADGYAIRCIFTSPEGAARLFLEVGEDAILMDSNLDQDRAWYGQHELSPTTDGETMILYCLGEECWFKTLEGL